MHYQSYYSAYSSSKCDSHFADLNHKNGTELLAWKKHMITRRRKTLVVCQLCHMNIHHGRYDGESFRRKFTGEPYDAKVSRTVRREVVGKVHQELP